MKIQIGWLKKEKLGPEEKQACAIKVYFDSGEERGTFFVIQYKDGRIAGNFLDKEYIIAKSAEKRFLRKNMSQMMVSAGSAGTTK